VDVFSFEKISRIGPMGSITNSKVVNVSVDEVEFPLVTPNESISRKWDIFIWKLFKSY